MSGGTDNHLMLVDLRSFDADLSGKKARLALDRGGHQPQREHGARRPPPAVHHAAACASARPAVTTQGMREPEMAQIAALIHRVLVGREDEGEVAAVRDEVVALCSKFAPYPT